MMVSQLFLFFAAMADPKASKIDPLRIDNPVIAPACGSTGLIGAG